jgi:uncharacterized protein YceK
MKFLFLCFAITFTLSACASHTTNSAEQTQPQNIAEKKAITYYSSAAHYPGGDYGYSVIWYVGHPKERHKMLAQCQKNGFMNNDCKHARLAAIKSNEVDPLKEK